MKRFLSTLLIFVLLISAVPISLTVSANTTDFAGGSGTESDPYLIATKYQLDNVRDYPEAHFKMTADVVFTDADFSAGGDFYNAGNFFVSLGSLAGSFDGNGHAIKNLKINCVGSSGYTALFYQISSGAVLKNLYIEGGVISGSTSHISAFAGRNSGTIENCRNTATITANVDASLKFWAGGIVADNSGYIQNCRNDGDISASCVDPSSSSTVSAQSSYVGGIAAHNRHTVTDCHNSGRVYSRGKDSALAGGIIGFDESSMGCKTTGCSNAGAVTADAFKYRSTPHLYAGGIVGTGNVCTSIINCYNIGNVTVLNGSQGFAGGIMGKHGSNEYIKNCYNLGEISSGFDVIDAYVGGVTGYNDSNGRIWSCYNAGRVFGKATDLCYAGGVSGYCLGRLTYCYNNANVTGETESQWASTVYAGGVVGLLSSQYVNAINCYNTGDVSGAATNDAYIGGFVGYLKYSYGNSYISGVDYANYTTGMVSKSDPDKGTAYLGAVAGKGDSQLVGSENAFYYISNGLGARGTGTIYNCYNRSTYQMGYKYYLEYMDFDSIWYFDKSCGFEYPQLKENPQAKPKQLVLLSAPASIPFKEGVAPELNDIQIKVIYENGLTATVDVTHGMLPDLNLALIGKQEVRVKYGGIYSDGTLTFEGVAKKLTAVKVIKQPDKIRFHQDEASDFTGLVVYAYYDNQQSESISDYEITALDTSSAGNHLITVSKGGFYDAFYVSVTEHDYYHEFSSQMHWLQCCYCTDKLEESPHVFENDCDSDCVCGFTRLTEHQYDHSCDSDCNVCGQFRPISHNHVPSYDDIHHFYYCTVCGDKVHINVHMFSNDCDTTCDCGYVRNITHNYKDAYNAAGHFEECSICGYIGSGEPHTFDNDCDTNCDCGYVRTITHRYGEYIYNNDATTTKDGTKTRTCSVCGATQTVTAAGTKWTNPFTDVKETDFYYTPVLWAVENGITSGTSKTTFGPNEACTRGQIATFLWRAAGCPAPKTSNNPFTDVKSSDFYYKAVLWAVGEGITSGTSKTTFGSNAPCTRGQIATFLHRAAGSPAPKGSNNPFKDVGSNQYYYKAVLWAVENNITSGTSATTFSPNAACTRGQIVTFLYRSKN